MHDREPPSAPSPTSGPPSPAESLGERVGRTALWAGGKVARAFVRFGRKIAVAGTWPKLARTALWRAEVASTRAVWSGEEERWSSRLDRRRMAGILARSSVRALTRGKPVIYRVRQRRPTLSGHRPRIVHAIPNVFLGGSTQLVVDLFDHLGHAYEMAVVTSALPPGRHEGMPVLHVPQGPALAERLDEAIARFAPDIVHVHFWGETDTPWYEPVFERAAAGDIPVIQNVNTPVVPFRHAGVRLSIYVSDYVRTTFGRPAEASRVIHPGIDFGAFSPPRELDPRSFDSIGMVYRLERDKLDPDAIEPLIRAVKRRPRTRAFVIGSGSLFDPFVQRTIAAGVRDNFVFTGAVPYGDLPALYAAFRVFVAPVARESFGQVVPFAMNMGLAVAGNRIGALPEILGSDETLGVDPDDTARRIVALLDDPERMAALGQRNRAIATAKFGLDDMIRAYDEAYAEILAAGTRHGSMRVAGRALGA